LSLTNIIVGGTLKPHGVYMTKTKKFFVVVTSLMLVFAMIGCPNSTSSGGSNTPIPSYPQNPVPGGKTTVYPFIATTAALLDTYLDTVSKGTIYVAGNIEANENVSLKSGQTLVIADLAYAESQKWPNPNANVQASVNEVSSVSRLTIKKGFALTVEGNAAVVVGNPVTLERNGVLLIEGGAGLTVQGNATLAITSASHVIVEKAAVGETKVSSDSGITILPGANVAFIGVEDSAIAGTIQTVATGGTVAANAFIAIEATVDGDGKATDSAPAAISPDIEVYNDYSVDNGTESSKNITAQVKNDIAEKVAEIAEASPSKITNDPTEAVALLTESGTTTTKVTYTGTDALTGTGGAAFTVPENKTLVIKSAVVDGSNKITLASGAKLEIASGASIDFGVAGTLAGAPGSTVTNNGTIKTATSDADQIQIFLVEAKGKIESSGSVSLPTATVQSGTELTISGSITNTGNFTNDGVVTLSGTFTNSGSGTYNKASKGTFFVSNTDALNSAVAFNVPTISLNDAFYTNATALVVIGSGDPAHTSANPVVIKGLGKDSTALSVGVQIANDYITLRDVKIAIADSTKAKKTLWMATPSYYYSAVFLGRSTSDASLHVKDTDDPVHNVSLLNSSITVTASTAGYTAGVWVDGNYSDKTASPPAEYYYNAARNITISGNTIDVTGNGVSAAQGIALSPYHSSITITGNTIRAKHAGSISDTPFDRPASAIYVRVASNATDSGNDTPNISGNTIHNEVATLDTKSTYSFYFNAYNGWRANDATLISPYDGITDLKTYKFGNYETTWALPNNDTSVYKKLFNALLANITGTNPGFAVVSSELSGADYAFEQYKIEGGKVTSISVHGFHIATTGENAGKYENKSTEKGDNKFDSTSGNALGKDYGSFSFTYDASGNVATDATNGVTTKTAVGGFWITYNRQDTDYTYGNAWVAPASL
jgi:hypothetical protein